MLFTPRALPSTSGAIFIMVSVACMAASSSYEICSMIPRPPSCDCSNTAEGYELRCSAFTVQVEPNAVVHIQCDNKVVSDFPVLSGTCFGEVDTLIIRQCPLPTVSLNQLMKNMGVSSVNNLQLTFTGVNGNSEMSVTRELFHGLSNVTSLTLHSNGTTILTDDVFTDMHNLIFIDLKSNKLVLWNDIFCGVTKLLALQLFSYIQALLEPGIFHNLIHLQKLVLSGNMVRVSRSVFSDIKNLVSLDINSTELNSLPSDLFVDLPKLRNINLYANEFIVLPLKLFMNNSDLETVKIQNNRRTLETLPPRMLADLAALKIVTISNCNMSTLPEDLIWGSVSIHTISLNNNAFITLPETLFRECEKLQSLDISYNRITDLPNHIFSSVLNLKHLKINNNQLTVITNQLFLPLRDLMVLDLKDNRLTHVETQAFEMLSALISVNMSNNMLTFNETDLSPLNYCGMLENIDLENNTLNKMFSDWLHLENLETLNLAYNKISQIREVDLLFVTSKDISVNVSYNNISEIDIFSEKRDYAYRFYYPQIFYFKQLRKLLQILEYGGDIKFIQIYIEGNVIKCDCNIPSFYIQKYRILVLMETNPENLQCANLEENKEIMLQYLQPRHVSCFLRKEYSLNCPEQCKCLLSTSSSLSRTLLINCNQRNSNLMTTRNGNLFKSVFPDTHNLENLEVDSVKMTSLPSNFLLDLTELRYISLYGNEFLYLPQDLFENNRNLYAVNIVDNTRKLSTLPRGLLGNLIYLREFTLRNCNTSSLPEDLLWSSTAISWISLNWNAFTTLPEMLFKDCSNLETLDISHNHLTNLPERLFSVTINLIILKINNNRLTHIPNGLFSSLWNLRVIDLKDNRLSLIETRAFMAFQELRSLDMSNNLLTFREISQKGTWSPLIFCVKLKDIQLANNSFTKTAVDWRQFQELETLNLSYNKIFQIKAEDLHFTGVKNTFVNISYNNISEFDIFENKRVYKYVSGTTVYNVPVREFFIEGNPTKCDCELYTFLQYNEQEMTAEIRITTETATTNFQCVKLRAYTGQELHKIPIKYFTCLLKTERILNCPEACSCLLFPTTKTMVVDCHQTNLLSTPARENVMHNISKDIFSKAHNLESLEIKWNRMAGLTPNLFSDLVHLRKINMYANKFQSLPRNLFVNNTILEKINIESNGVTLKTLPPRFLAGLTKLRDVKLNGCNMSNLPEDLLWESTSINTISLKNNALATLPEQLFIHCYALQTLDISFNRITDLSKEMFRYTLKLKTLKINNNELTILRDYFLPLNKLEILDLKYNRLINVEPRTFSRLTSLKAVDMSNNILTDYRIEFDNRYPNLEDIQFANNSLTVVPWQCKYLTNLKTLNLARNKISQLQVGDFFFRSSNNIFVNITYNNISDISILSKNDQYDKYDFSNNHNNYVPETRPFNVPVRHFFLEGNPITCDCKTYSFLENVKQAATAQVKLIFGTEPYNSQCIHIEGNTEKLNGNIPMKYFTCLYKNMYNPICPEQCSCLFRTLDKALGVECQQRNLTSMPALQDIWFSNYTELNLSRNRIKSIKYPLGLSYSKVTKYILSDNMISEIDLTVFSPELQSLELDGNNIIQFNKSSIEFLMNSTFLTQLSLHNNPWRCDCTAKNFVSVLKSIYHLRKIKSLENVTCENGKEILKMSDTELCPVEAKIIISGILTVVIFGLSFALLIACLLLLYCKFQTGIKIWLYAHRCCLRFVTEDELDQDKVYDVFVSYAYQDEDFVMDHLVPRLEDEQYTLCLHQRDWIPGEFISAQIIKSVQSSRRTLVILSRSFLESAWGLMEFRVAHEQAMRDERVRVIVILYGDIEPTGKLHSELQTYITMNTYVKWGDNRFWDKLLYAMPHSSKLCTEIPLQERT